MNHSISEKKKKENQQAENSIGWHFVLDNYLCQFCIRLNVPIVFISGD